MRLKAPAGWRMLRNGEVIKPGDRFLCHDEWMQSTGWVGKSKVGNTGAQGPYIRRIKKGRKK